MGERKIIEHFVVLKDIEDPFWRLFTSRPAPGLLEPKIAEKTR
jgi:hypothetical protein